MSGGKKSKTAKLSFIKDGCPLKINETSLPRRVVQCKL